MWVVLCAALTLLMQGGFCCLESGLSRGKNSINVAMKNVADLCLSILAFWLIGHGLMFGESAGGFIGLGGLASAGEASPSGAATFLFQLLLCGTAVTIISGAIAERARFSGYIWITLLVSALVYPISGHWVWHPDGWLNALGFVDLAGSTVVHGVGGAVALVAAWVIGPRVGRFSGAPPIQGHNLPMERLRSRLEQAIAPQAAIEAPEALATLTELPALALMAGLRAQKTILLAEDNSVNRVVAREMLTRAGFNCLLAHNGREAVELFEREAVDLVLMDCQMPVMDGFEATRLIREASAHGAEVPIVALTANTITADRARCLAVGMNEHLTKPVEPEVLVTILDRLLTLPRPTQLPKDTIPTHELLMQIATKPGI